jgi:threonine synthase
MNYYSTNNKNLRVDLREAVIRGLAPDNGLYMPEQIPLLSRDFISSLPELSFGEIAYGVADSLIGSDIPQPVLSRIIDHTIQFDAPLVEIEKDIYALELFHGPTLAFKDFGARFMSQLLGYFAGEQGKEITILVATSGDTGSAVANGFLGVAGIRVVVLYPSGKVSDIQEKQFTTLGENITAIEIDGTFDDCQRLVKQAFLDPDLKSELFLSSANSINIARLIPQSFYYFYAYSRLVEKKKPIVFSVPSGNFGNLTGGIFAMKMGLPIFHFVAATNVNDVVPEYLQSAAYNPRPSRSTISNAMDVGNPSNFARLLDLFEHDHRSMASTISGFTFSDEETSTAMKQVYGSSGYLMDPHGSVGYLGIKAYKQKIDSAPIGVFLETAHPAKFMEVVNAAISDNVVRIPDPLKKFLHGRKKTISMSAEFGAFKKFLASF